MTKYDGSYTGDQKIDNSVWYQKLNSYLPLVEGFFIMIGCLIPVFLGIAMRRDSHSHNNNKAWMFLGIVSMVLIVMLYLSVKGVKPMTSEDKKFTRKKS